MLKENEVTRTKNSYVKEKRVFLLSVIKVRISF